MTDLRDLITQAVEDVVREYFDAGWNVVLLPPQQSLPSGTA